jgi:hypothetical protein
MDGNFSAEHMRSRTHNADVPLSAGMGFMANPESYKAHLKSGKEVAQVYWTLSSSNSSSLQSYSQAHATHTRPLNKQIQVGHTLMLQASEQPPVVMAFLFLCR